MAEASDQATVDRRSLMMGAAALGAAGVASMAMATSAPPAGATTPVLDPSPSAGVANRIALQAAINATPAGEVLVLPEGTFPIDVGAASITLGASITIVGSASSGTTLDVSPKTTGTMNSLFVVSTAVASGNFGFEYLRIDGPTSTSGGGSAIEWVRRGATGNLSCFLVTITGQFQYGIRRSGVGLVNVVASAINARGIPISVTDNSSGAGPSRCIVAGSSISGFGATTASIGVELQPHIAFQCAATRFEHLSQLAVSVQSGPTTPVPGSWTMSDCQVVDAGLAATGPVAHATFARVVQTVASSWPVTEAILRGPTTFIECDLRNAGTFTLPAGVAAPRRFLSCWFEPRSIFLSAGPSTIGTLTFDECTWKLAGGARTLNLTSGWTGNTRLRRSRIADCGTTGSNILNVQNGTLGYVDFTIDSPRANGGLAIGSATTVTGSPTLVNTGTCPTSPTH